MLEPNLHFEGNTVLSLGIKEKKTNDIYYLQQSIDNANIKQMIADAKLELNASDHDNESMQDLELYYLLLGQDPTKIDRKKVTESFEIDGLKTPIDVTKDYKGIFGTVDGRVPDSIFKSGPFDEWDFYTNWNVAAPYHYVYATFRFAGTENRLTYIALFNLVRNNNFSTQSFSFNFDLVENVSVLYNVYNDEIFLFGDNNRLRGNDIEIYNESNTINGIFWSREYHGRTTGSFLNNITKAVLIWVEPASKIVSSIEELTAPTQTQTGTKYTYQSTVEGQEQAYGHIINYVGLYDSGSIKNNDDYLLIEADGTGIDSINQGFSYTIVLQ